MVVSAGMAHMLPIIGLREHDQHSFISIRVLFADNFVQFGLSLPHNNQLDFAILTQPFRH